MHHPIVQVRLIEHTEPSQLAAFYSRNRDYHYQWSPMAPEEFYIQ